MQLMLLMTARQPGNPVERRCMNKLVMIIDPSVLSSKILEICLRRAGLESINYPTGEEALHALAAKPRHIPAMIVLEIDLPGIDGLEVIRLLRSDPTFDAVRIVVFSGHETRMKRLQAKWAGADQFLPKPFDRRRFLALVSEYIGAERPSTLDVSMHASHRGGWNNYAIRSLHHPGSTRPQSIRGLYAYSARG